MKSRLLNLYLERFVKADLLDRIEIKRGRDSVEDTNPIEKYNNTSELFDTYIAGVRRRLQRSCSFRNRPLHARLYINFELFIVEGVDGQGKTTFCNNKLKSNSSPFTQNRTPSHDAAGEICIERSFINNPLEVLSTIKFLDERDYYSPNDLTYKKHMSNINSQNMIWAITSDILRFLTTITEYSHIGESNYLGIKQNVDNYLPTFCLINDRSVLSALVYNQEDRVLDGGDLTSFHIRIGTEDVDNVNFFIYCFNASISTLKYILYEFKYLFTGVAEGTLKFKPLAIDGREDKQTIPNFVEFFGRLVNKIIHPNINPVKADFFENFFDDLADDFDLYINSKLTEYFTKRKKFNKLGDYDKNFLSMYYDIIMYFVNNFKVKLNNYTETYSVLYLYQTTPNVVINRFNRGLAERHVKEEIINKHIPELNIVGDYSNRLVEDMEKLHNRYSLYADIMDDEFLNS